MPCLRQRSAHFAPASCSPEMPLSAACCACACRAMDDLFVRESRSLHCPPQVGAASNRRWRKYPGAGHRLCRLRAPPRRSDKGRVHAMMHPSPRRRICCWRGTAYFARKLGEMADDALGAPSLRKGVNRRALIAEVGYHARALALAVAAARAGRADPMCQRFCGPSGQHRARPEPAPNPIPVRGTFLAGPGRPIAFERRDRRSRV